MAITERNQEGKIVKSTLSSERARELVDKRWAKQRGDDLADLLSLFGYDTAEDAPADLRLLAQKAISSKTGSVSALLQLMKIQQDPKGQKVVSVSSTWDRLYEPCPTCGSKNLFDYDAAKYMVKELRKLREGEQTSPPWHTIKTT